MSHCLSKILQGECCQVTKLARVTVAETNRRHGWMGKEPEFASTEASTAKCLSHVSGKGPRSSSLPGGQLMVVGILASRDWDGRED